MLLNEKVWVKEIGIGRCRRSNKKKSRGAASERSV